jgi:mono/diheme cytochrome c family protein
MRSWLRGAGGTAVVLAGIVTAGTLSGRPAVPQPSSPAAPTQLTFNRDIAPLTFRTCSTCHRPGEAAPFSLLTYSDVKKHARQIAEVTRNRSMPPWLPEPQKLKFAGELRLTDAEIDSI